IHRPGRPRPPTLPGRPRPATRENLYARPANANRITRDVPPNGKVPRPATKLPNNVYADKDGNVFRRDKKGNWEQRDNGKWTRPGGESPVGPPTRPAPGTNPSGPETRP